MDIQNLIASIQLADLQRRGYFKPPGDIKAIARASKQVSNLIYADDIDRDAGGEPEMAEPNLVTIMDPPDAWGVRHSLGLAELAARLGSPVTYDRRGDVIWYDDFESGVEKWRYIGAGGGLDWASDAVAKGGFSGKLYTKNVADSSVLGLTYLPMPLLSKIGIELSLFRSVNTKYIIIELLLYDGTNRYDARATYTLATETWQYQDSGGVDHNLLPTLELSPTYTQFHVIKLVADFTTGLYTRLLVNNIFYDLSNLAMQATAAPAQAPSLHLNLSVTTNANISASIHIDNVILTQNEPA